MAEEPKAPYNSADPVQVKVRKRKVDLARERELNDLRQVLSTVQGRRVFWRLFGLALIFQPTFTGDPYTSAWNEGGRNLGLRFLNDVLEACPERFAEAQAEARATAEPEPKPQLEQEDDTDG